MTISMTVVFWFLPGLLPAHAQINKYAEFDTSTEDREQPWGLFINQMDEIDSAELMVLEGTVPGWISGSMYKVGAGAYEIGGRKVNNVIDGLGKVYRWTFTPGQSPTFATKFVKSTIYNRSMSEGELVPHRTVGEMSPPVTTKEKVKMLVWDGARDNNNITPWLLKGRKGLTITAETPSYFDVQMSNLDFLAKYKIVNNGIAVKEFMSASHFAKHPTTGDSYNYIYVTGLDLGWFTGRPPGYQMVQFTQDDTGNSVGNKIGHIPVPLSDMRIVHSLGVTEDYVVLPRLSIKVVFNSSTHFCSNIKIDHRTPTEMHVMSIDDGSFQTFTFPPFISVHIINSFQRVNSDGDTEVIVDFPTLSTIHDFPEFCYYEILNVNQILDRNFLYRQKWRPLTDVTLRRFVMNMNTGGGHVQDFPQMWKPRHIHIDFPFVSDLYRGRDYCYVYLHTIQWDNDNAMGILKVDLCRGRSSNWETLNQFPVEPVFVPRPGGTHEDDGVLMTPVYDTLTNKTQLYIWDAKDLTVVARVETTVRVPWTNHGIWRPDEVEVPLSDQHAEL